MAVLDTAAGEDALGELVASEAERRSSTWACVKTSRRRPASARPAMWGPARWTPNCPRGALARVRGLAERA